VVLGEKFCVRCGRRTLGWHYGPDEGHQQDDGLCPECRGDDYAAADIKDGETEFIGEDEARCPWCGKRIPHDSEDLATLQDGEEEDCPHCGKRFWIRAECHWTYNTGRADV